MKALGMVEVRGYLGAVSAADEALKAAEVSLNSTQRVGGGLTTIMLVGDVSAVQAAVDAASAIAKRLGCFRSSHVIPKVDVMTAHMLGGRIAGESGTVRSPQREHQEAFSNHRSVTETSGINREDNVTITVGAAEINEPADDSEITLSAVNDSISTPSTTDHEEALADETKAETATDIVALQKQLEACRVTELRKIAYRIRVSGLKRTAIKFANKETLVRVILEEAKRGELIEFD